MATILSRKFGPQTPRDKSVCVGVLNTKKSPHIATFDDGHTELSLYMGDGEREYIVRFTRDETDHIINAIIKHRRRAVRT
jgi:hypothetical protein